MGAAQSAVGSLRMNPIGIISMSYARPFTAAQFPLFQRVRAAGLDFVEMLVPEPGEVPIGELRAAIEGAGLAVASDAARSLYRLL